MLTEPKTRWDAIRKIYRIAYPNILAGKYDAYLADWTRIFTPIENDAWCSIREHGLPFYPQYPALNYFLDFADPIKKIALECDGAQWHDAEKDAVRDAALRVAGWTIYRITGSECARSRSIESPAEVHERFDDYGDQDGFDDHVERWAMASSDGVIAAIALTHYARRFLYLKSDISGKTLRAHTTAKITEGVIYA